MSDTMTKEGLDNQLTNKQDDQQNDQVDETTHTKQAEQPEDSKSPEEKPEEKTVKQTALIAALKKELKNKEELQGIKDVSELAEKYLETLSHLKNPAPATPDEYELTLAEELKDKAKDLDTEEGRQAFKQVLKQLGIPKDKGAGVYNLVISSLLSVEEGRTKAMMAARQKAEEELKKQLGDKYKEVFSQTLNAVKKVADEDFVKLLDETGIGNDPRFVKTLYKLISMPKEDRLISGDKTEQPKPGVFVFRNTPGMDR